VLMGIRILIKSSSKKDSKYLATRFNKVIKRLSIEIWHSYYSLIVKILKLLLTSTLKLLIHSSMRQFVA